jgi:eukaryotic-like serine/threonine-protein kinase
VTPERWRKIEEIYHAALERQGRERAAYLDAACAGDDLLYREVDSLLANAASTDQFLEKPAIDAAARMLADEQVRTYSAGQQLGDYTIIAPLGAGGMGVVYRARDTRLKRDVAIKMLPSFVSADRDRLRRFEQEAHAVAALNHPNILAVFQMGEHQGTPYLVSEFLEGSTLREQLKRGPVPLRKALDFGAQIARGLAAAHEKGIVHRDLKPENLLITTDGRVKILDFGLAKLTPRAWTIDSKASTVSDLTQPGVVLGTVGYMSPEQVRGGAVDHRADIFSFGAVLYEMVTGKRAFQKATPPETMSAILNEDPPAVSQAPSTAPAGLQRVIQRCLEKNPGQRFQSAADLAFALEAVSSGGSGSAVPVARQSPRRVWLWAASASAAVVLGVMAGGYFHYFPRARLLTDKDTIVVGDFANTTGDPVFDGTLGQGLSVQLEQSPFLSIVPDQQIQKTLEMMGQKPDAKLTPEIAQDLCERVGSAAAIEGSIAQIGAPYLITIKAVNCSNGKTMASTEAQAGDKDHVLDALGRASSEIRSNLGESLSTVQKFDTPLEQATTPSLDALKAYSQAMRAISTGNDTPSAIPLMKRAIELDPHFALAYDMLSLQYQDLGESAIAAEYARKAYELRTHTSEPEKYFATARYDKEVTGDIPAAIQACQLWIGAYPRSWMPHTLLEGSIYPIVGEYEKAVTEGKEAIGLNPNAPAAYSLLMDAEIALNRVDEAKATYEQARKRKLSSTGYGLDLYQIAFLRHDSAGMAQQVAASVGQTGTEDQVLASEAETAAYYGQFERARSLSRQAMDSAEQANEQEPAATYLAISAVREALSGNANEGEQRAKSALARSTARDVQYAAALSFALAGDDKRTEGLADDLSKKYPEDTLVQFNFMPTLRGLLALNRGNASEALAALRAATPYELGATRFSVLGWTGMYPVYVRGRAYLAARKDSEAAAEFQKILDHPGVVLNEPIGALAHLGLARAYAMQGDAAKAKLAYQDFLALWTHADSDIPILKQAKTEYAKLQ